MVVNASSSYNIIIDRPMFNALEAALSTLYLTKKFSLEKGKTCVVKGIQELARQCYRENMMQHKR